MKSIKYGVHSSIWWRLENRVKSATYFDKLRRLLEDVNKKLANFFKGWVHIQIGMNVFIRAYFSQFFALSSLKKTELLLNLVGCVLRKSTEDDRAQVFGYEGMSNSDSYHHHCHHHQHHHQDEIRKLVHGRNLVALWEARGNSGCCGKSTVHCDGVYSSCHGRFELLVLIYSSTSRRRKATEELMAVITYPVWPVINSFNQVLLAISACWLSLSLHPVLTNPTAFRFWLHSLALSLKSVPISKLLYTQDSVSTQNRAAVWGKLNLWLDSSIIRTIL